MSDKTTLQLLMEKLEAKPDVSVIFEEELKEGQKVLPEILKAEDLETLDSFFKIINLDTKGQTLIRGIGRNHRVTPIQNFLFKCTSVAVISEDDYI